MGRHAGSLLNTSGYRGPRYDSLVELRQSAFDIMEEDDSELELFDDAIVLTMYQGETFDFIRAWSGHDPAVYGYRPADKEFVQCESSLTEYLYDAAHDDWYDACSPRTLEMRNGPI